MAGLTMPDLGDLQVYGSDAAAIRALAASSPELAENTASRRCLIIAAEIVVGGTRRDVTHRR